VSQSPVTTGDDKAWTDQVLKELPSYAASKDAQWKALDKRPQEEINREKFDAAPGADKAMSAQDDAWAQQVLAELPLYSKDMSAWEKTKAGSQGVGVGLVESARNVLVDLPLSIQKAAGLPQSSPDDAVPMADWLKTGLDAATNAMTPSDLRAQDSGWYSAGNIGGKSILPLGTALMGGPVAGGLFGAMQQGGASGADAMRSGGSGEAVGGAMLGGAVVGGIGGAIVDGVLTRINTKTGNKIVEALLRDGGDLAQSSAARSALVRTGVAAVRTGESALAGGATGLTYNALVNSIHNYATDDDISILMNSEQALGAGIAFGTMIRGATEAALARRMHTGRKYTANGWEGPELDMSGLLDTEPSPFEPPITKTPDEHFAPLVDSAARAVGSEIHTGVIPRDATVEDLAAIMQSEHGLPLGKALEAAQAALDETARLDEAKRNASVLEAHTAWQARQAEVAAETEKYRAVYEQRAAEARAKDDAAVTKAHQEWQARRQANAADADKWKAVYEQRVAQAQEAESKRIQEAHTALQERQAKTASEADVWKTRFEESQRARQEAETARVRDEHVRLQERQQELSAEETKWRDEYRRRNPDPERPPNAEPDSALGKTIAREGLQSEAQRAYEERLAKAKAEADRVEALWQQAAAEANPGQAAELGVAGPRLQKAGSPMLRAEPGTNPVVDRSGRTIVDIGDGLRGTEDDKSGLPTVTYKADVRTAMLDAARMLNPNVALRIGMLPDDVLGLQNDTTNVVRVQSAQAIGTIAHEISHAVETRILGSDQSPFMGTGGEALANELIALGKKANPGETAPHATFLSEGWAEFMRLWLGQHEDLMGLAPKATQWFDGRFLKQEPEFAKKMDMARATFDAWRFQGSVKRTAGGFEKPVSLAQKLTNWTNNFRSRAIVTAVYSSWDVLRRYENAKAAAGFPTPKEQRLDRLMTAFAGNAHQVAEKFVLKDGTSDIWGHRTGDSLKRVVEKMRGRDNAQSDLNSYMKAQRTVWLAEKKGRVVDREFQQTPIQTGQTVEDAKSTIARLEAKHPMIGEVADGVRAWHDRVMDYVVQADPAFGLVRNAMRQEGEIYFMLRKAWDESAPVSRRGTKNAARTGKLGERFTEGGSDRPTKDILPAMQQEALRLIKIAHERIVLRSLVENGKAAGFGALFEDISATLTGKAEGYTVGKERPAADFEQASVEAFFEPAGVDASGRATFKYAELEVNPDTGKTRVVMKTYAVHPEIYDAIVGMNPQDFRNGLNWAANVARWSAKAQVVGHIVINPVWTFYKNLLWDPQTAYTNTRYNSRLRDMLLDWAPNLLRVGAYEVSNGIIPYKWADAYHNLNIDLSSPVQSELRSKNISHDLLASRPKTIARNITSPDAWFQMVAKIMSPSDVAPRVWEFKRAAKQVGWKPGEPMTQAQYVEMAIATKSITGNRSEGGRVTNELNKFIPFMRAWAVGPRDTVRAATAGGNKLRFAIHAANIAALSGLYYAYYGHDKKVAARPAGEAMSYAMIPNDTGDAWNFPIAPEVAPIWGVVQFVLGAFDANDESHRSGWEIAQAAWDLEKPPFVPAVLEEPYKQLANKQRIGSNVPLIPNDELARKPKDQFGIDTAPVAVALARVFPWVSPRRLESAIEGIFGVPGRAALGEFETGFGMELTLDPANEKGTLRDVLEGNFLRKGGALSDRSVHLSRLSSMAAAAEANRLDPDLPFNADAELARATLAQAQASVSVYRAMMRTYKMSAKQKQDLYAEMNRAAKDAVESVLLGKPNLGGAVAANMTAEQARKIRMLTAPQAPFKPKFKP